jgi:uncharacterized protein YbcC (UPF0753/DUF2309 family)
MKNLHILNSIDKASNVIGKTWPLYSFVASNPLSGYENASFEEAVGSAQKHLNASAFPSANRYREAWEKGDIHTDVLISLLKENGLPNSPEESLKLLESQTQSEVVNSNHDVDRIMVKWLSAFLDEGIAEWDMPFKTEGFYTAWRHLAIYDSETGSTSLRDIPKTSAAALDELMKDFTEEECTTIFTYQLSALPGWTGYINHRTSSGSAWQEEYPISLMDYLAARIWTVKKLNLDILPSTDKEPVNEILSNVQYTWLKAWEQSWQNQLVKILEIESNASQAAESEDIPDAQLVFCIDTRSELIRRHVESHGNYETFGYAGFFGIAMDYTSLNDGITRKSCPPIVSSAYTVSETAQSDKEENFEAYGKRNELQKFTTYFLNRMKNMLPSAFGYVEGSGIFYGISLFSKTVIPRSLYKKNQLKESAYMESMCEPNLQKVIQEGGSDGIPLVEKVGIVKSAFDLLGWQKFAPVIVFAGHGSHSANNPFGSSLDCGACAASPGRHNARALAKLANLPEVRKALAETHGIFIPEETVFIGAEHNTTTDDIVLFDSEVKPSHKQRIADLKVNLLKAQKTATEDRLGSKTDSVSAAQKKANNWGETRPEWGLAKNAGFIVGPRNLTKKTNLDSRCFLHSYNWELDSEGTALEGIMQGPMVVTQWINNHYYFSTVDNNAYGGGTKITHNITGKFGVVQGNGGDLKMGLPLQSLFQSDEDMYHQPLRLSVMIQAPIARVSDILSRNSNLKTLLDNEWIYLMVMDPTSNNEISKYNKSMQWVLTRKSTKKKGALKEVHLLEELTL